MASLRQLATEYINALNKPFDNMLYERIKALLIHERAQEYRRSVAKNGIDEEFLQRYKIELQLVDISDAYGIDFEKKILRSKNKIANLVRYINDSPFTYVGTLNGSYPFIYMQPYAIASIDNLEYAKGINAYTFRNQYIYVYSRNTSLEAIYVETIFAEPHKIDNSDSSNPNVQFTDDMEFLISEDLIQTIKSKLLSGELRIDTSSQEIDIVDENDR